MALVAPSGNVEWLCLPTADGPSVFGALLDRHAGGFRLAPADMATPAARRYLPGTMVLETSWGTPTGWIIVRDLLLIGPWHHEHDLSHTHQRAPTDYDADHVLLRTVRCVNGEVQVELECEPMFDYGRQPASWHHTGPTYHQCRTKPGHARVGAHPHQRPAHRVRGGQGGGPHAAQGGRPALLCPLVDRARPADELRGGLRPAHLDRPPLAALAGPWPVPGPPVARAPGAQRAHAEGADLRAHGRAPGRAAPPSLPETPGGERNWDYRYTWIRDSVFALWALHTLGFDWEANDFFWFIADIAERDDELQVMYRADGSRDLHEETLDHLSGYEGARPVRIGNGAYRQRQHDVWGAVLDSVAIHTRSVERLDERLWPILKRQVEGAIAQLAPARPGHLGGAGRAAALHVLEGHVLGGARPRGQARPASAGRRAGREVAGRGAQDIHDDVCSHALDERGVFTQHYETDALDASLLLMPLLGFLPPDRRAHPGHRARHRRRAERRRARAALPGGARPTTVCSGEEGTFTICSFWLVSALALIGERRASREALPEAAVAGEPARPLRGGDRPGQRPPPRELPAGVHPPRAHQRGDDPRRPAGASAPV